MKVVTEVKDLDDFLQKNLKPSEVPAYVTRIEGFIKARQMFIQDEGVFVAERGGGSISFLTIDEYLESRKGRQGRQARTMKDNDILAFVRAGGNFI